MRCERLELSRVRRRAVPVRSKCVACVLENHGQSLKATPRTLSAPSRWFRRTPSKDLTADRRDITPLNHPPAAHSCGWAIVSSRFVSPRDSSARCSGGLSLQSYTLHDTSSRIHHWLQWCYRPIQRQGAPNLPFRTKRIDWPPRSSLA